jgi:hypothetical protein
MSFRFLNEGQRGNVQEFTPIDTFIDPVSKIRVSNPSNLIDTDFEYGLQPTKWETVELINNTPAFFSKSGDTTISDITGITTNSGTREVTVTTAFPHNLAVGIPIRVSGTKSVTADGSYIINATPTDTTFTYLARANQEQTISIFDLYTSIITGEFFQGSQISIDDAEGIVTNSAGPISTLTVKTPTKHGFGLNTPFYFLNLNSTISQEFESQNSASLSFDPSNSATAQTFDGSNTLLQTPVDLSNSATTSNFQSIITSTNPIAATITVSLSGEDWSVLKIGSPLYHSVSVGGGYFQQNPRGVVFIKNVDQINQSGGTATFQVSQIPDGPAIPILANMTGFFQIANQARTFAGNNINPETQIDLEVEVGQEFLFDGGNQGFDGASENPSTNVGTVVGYTGTSMTLFTSEGNLDYYEGAMLRYNSTGVTATGLTNQSTYFVTSFAPGQSAGLFTMSVAELPGGSPISISGGSGTQTFSKIGISIDKDIVHVRNSNFLESDMLEYTFPNSGQAGNFGADIEKRFYFVETAYDAHNYKLAEDVGFRAIEATGGNTVFDFDDGSRVWRVHQFTTVGTSTFTVTSAGSDGELEYLVVAGGGGGGSNYAGGGGGGGYRSSVLGENSGGNSEGESKLIVQESTYNVVVGGGGARGNRFGRGSAGQNSSFAGIIALGGGGGGAHNVTPGEATAGGSGGGGQGTNSASRAGGAGTANQGFKGGDVTLADASSSNSGAGGGGSGFAGQDRNTRNNDNGTDGGFGRATSITGITASYAAGGGGGAGGYGISGARGGNERVTSGAGQGGGVNLNGTNALANSGSGGGGGGANGASFGGNGGSGIVILRYPLTAIKPSGFVVGSGGNFSRQIIGGKTFAVHTFDVRDADQTFNILDPGATGIITVKVWGAAGGGSNNINNTFGGAGGYGTANVNISNISKLRVVVGRGGQGISGYNYGSRKTYGHFGLDTRSLFGGFGSSAGTGGGLSGIFNNTISQANAILVAGGGGGGGASSSGALFGAGGPGGGPNQNGVDGRFTAGTSAHGRAGTTSAGGLSGINFYRSPNGIAPSSVQANGAALRGGGCDDRPSSWTEGGGGGSGYFGGGAGAHSSPGGEWAAGAGGSGYANTSICTNITAFTAGYQGQTSQATSDIHWSSGISVPVAGAVDGGSGRVVIMYETSPGGN